MKLSDLKFSALMRSVAVGCLLVYSSQQRRLNRPQKIVALTLPAESLFSLPLAAILLLPLLSPFTFLRNLPVKDIMHVFLFPIYEASEELSRLAAPDLFLAV